MLRRCSRRDGHPSPPLPPELAVSAVSGRAMENGQPHHDGASYLLSMTSYRRDLLDPESGVYDPALLWRARRPVAAHRPVTGCPVSAWAICQSWPPRDAFTRTTSPGRRMEAR